MPTGNSSLHERALKRAFAHESVELTWAYEGEEIEFQAVKNTLPRSPDNVDRNDGDDTACTLTATVDAFPGLVPPGQGEFFTDAAGRRYRIERREWTTGFPKVVFHIANIVDP